LAGGKQAVICDGGVCMKGYRRAVVAQVFWLSTLLYAIMLLTS
jgi:hypothetical protein